MTAKMTATTDNTSSNLLPPEKAGQTYTIVEAAALMIGAIAGAGKG